MELQVGVKAFLQNRDGKYLLLKRSRQKYPDITNLWDIPGGRIVPGTSLLENLKRELLEETGLEVENDLILITAQDIILPEKHVVRLTYTGTISGLVLLNQGEHDDYLWISKEELFNFQGLDKYMKQILHLLPEGKR